MLAAALVGGCGDGLSGKYQEVGGAGSLEFDRGRVYVTSILGMTFVAEYEVDGDRVILKGAGGLQVFTRDGDSLNGGLGVRFLKVP